jgi:type IV pilus assembly protein PilY1
MNTNGKWFAVIASGPTGPIETNENQFLGRSDQPLRIFILDLITGTVVREINTGIDYAFGGSLNNATIDVERGARPSAAGRYSDDVLYLGYTEKDGTEWKKGGVLRLLTGNNPDPATWTWSKVIDNIGPVTSAVSHLQDRQNSKLWLYFGTGRYFYRLNGGMTLDDADNQRTIYGVKEPCYSSSNVINTGSCRMVSGLTNKTTDATATAASTDGWYINLGASSGNFKYERVITDPLATFSGVVYFTTFAPSTEVCEIGGRTYIWAADYQSGGRPSQLAMLGKAVIQVSSGAIEMIDLATGFTDNGGRKTGNPIMGIPPKGQGLSVLMAPRPMKKILQIKEK